MAVTKCGHQSYTDDPHGRVFRVIWPEFDDSELDQPPTDGGRRAYLQPDGTPHTWASFGTDSARTSTVAKVAIGTTAKLKGTPTTPASEPVIYWVNVDAILAALTNAENLAMWNWVNANPTWSNNFVDLGPGDVATLTTGLVSPCWIVVVDGGTPAVGTLQRTQTVHGHSFALWIA